MFFSDNAASHGKLHLKFSILAKSSPNVGQLTKEDEASTRGEEVQVRREDQEKINKFSTLHQKETALEEELKNKQVRLQEPSAQRGLVTNHHTEGEGRLRGNFHRA